MSKNVPNKSLKQGRLYSRGEELNYTETKSRRDEPETNYWRNYGAVCSMNLSHLCFLIENC
jgi:hypothetical protein